MRPITAILVVASLGMGSYALAQAPPPPASPPAAADQAPAGAPGAPDAGKDPIKAILDQETAVTPGGYTYNPQGRRDPFVSLQKPVEAETSRVRRPGLEGMLLNEVALRGIVRTEKGYTAMLQGTDGKSYFATAGQKMADGVITSLDASTITFRQEISDPLSVVKSREVKKSLYQSEEARQ